MLERFKRNHPNSEDQLVVSYMDKPYMYTQIWYKVSNKYALRNKLKKLKCVAFEAGSKNKFVIDNSKECKKYLSESNKSFHTIAAGKIISEDALRVSAFSLYEAIAVIEFLHDHTSPILTIESFEHVNCFSFVSTQEDIDTLEAIDYTEILRDVPTTCIWPNPQLLAQNNLITIKDLDEQEKLAYMEAFGESSIHASDTKKILINLDKMDYEDFIQGLYYYEFSTYAMYADMMPKDRQNTAITTDSTLRQIDDESKHDQGLMDLKSTIYMIDN